MKSAIFGLAASLALSGAAYAQTVEMDDNGLSNGLVSPGQDCVVVGVSMTVSATKGGRVTTYSTNAAGFSSGLYVGAVAGPPYDTTKNKTAPKTGLYRMTFSVPVTSVEFSIDAISNVFKPAETLSDFSTDNGPAQVTFQPVGNTAAFDPAKQIITANAGNGDGVVTHISTSKFSYFEFYHEQHPQNIGFTIGNVKVTPAPVACP